MKRFINYILISAFVFLISLSVTSCHGGSCVVRVGNENNTNESMSMAYDYMNGYKYSEFEVKEGKTMIVSFCFTTQSGEIDAYVAKDNNKENAAYKGDNIPTSEFSVTLKESGKYTVRVDARSHKGQYFISWTEQ